MADIVHVSTGLGEASRTDAVGARAVARLRERGHRVADVRVQDLPSESLLWRRTSDPAIAAALAVLESADAVVVSSGVYQASYSGLLKVFLDLLPKAGLRGKVVFPLLTGGSPAHVLSLDYALRPVLQSLGAAHVTAGRYVLSAAVTGCASGRLEIARVTADELDAATDDFADHLEARSRSGAFA